MHVFTSGGPHCDEHKLIRMEPDGSRYMEIFDFQSFASQQGAAFARAEMMIDGYCEFHLYTWHEEADGTMTGEWMKTYIYKLDGSWKEPRPLDAVGDPYANAEMRFLPYLEVRRNTNAGTWIWRK